ncbi:MAG: O-antigen ligase family protein [Pseudomonadota bacterium]
MTTYFHENNAVYDHRFNRFFTLTAMIFWPLAYYLLENKKTKNCLLLAGCLLLICIFSESAATVFALLTSVGVFMIAFFLPRAGMILVMVGTILMTYLMPWLASIGLRLTTPMRDTLPKGEIISRLEIWQAISTMIAENPVLGWGYRTSRQVYDLFYTQNPDVQLLVKGTTSHPHNNILEYWTELGVIGVSLWLGVMLSVLWRIKDLPNKTKAFALATFISYQAIAQVAYGAGQANWLAQTCFAVIVAGVIFAPRPTPQVDRSGAPSA